MSPEQPTTLTPIQPLMREATYVVFDFETLTPVGRPPEPIELAAMCITPGFILDQAWSKTWLIQPPAETPITAFDTRQTGIRAHDLQEAPNASATLKIFDQSLPKGAIILVAHHARYDMAILRRFKQDCPSATSLPCIDTIALGKHVVPGLANYQLDTLAHHFRLPFPQQRHRALPDVRLTVQVFLRLVARLIEQQPTATIADLITLSGIRQPPGSQTSPIQPSLWE